MTKDLSHISKKSKMIAATAFVLGLTVVGGGAIAVSAATDISTTASAHDNPMQALVAAIASRFGLNTSDVQAVVDNVMTAKRAEMEAKQQQNVATRLSQAVTDGKITSAQAALITAKAAEVKATFEADRTTDQTLTEEQRMAKMKARMDSLKAWATTNNIPEQYLRFVGGHGGPGMGGRGHGGFGGHAGINGQAPVPTTTPAV